MLTNSQLLDAVLTTTIKGHHVADRLQFPTKGRFLYTFALSAKSDVEMTYVFNLLCDAILEYYQ